MTAALKFRAGPTALKHIQEQGLCAADIALVAGAAGGPKWLTLAGIDRWLFSQWLSQRNQPLNLIGSSAGAWRMAAACGNDLQTLDELTKHYIEQCYEGIPSPSEISETAVQILRSSLLRSTNDPDPLLSHPIFRLNIITARCFGGLALGQPSAQKKSGAAAFIANAVSRKHLRFWFERVIFQDQRDAEICAELQFTDLLGNRFLPLEPNNLEAALLASGSIPLVMNGVSDPVGAPTGMYRDGGVVDYHMDLALAPQEGIVLLPHFSSRVVPGWLDKALPWRTPKHLDRTLLIHPSDEFVSSLPNKKIPDRNDFKLYFERDTDRIRDWYTVVNRSEELGDALAEALELGTIKKLIEPI